MRFSLLPIEFKKFSMKERNAQFILGILYAVGVFGYLSSYSTQFANLTCLNLLISLFAVLYYHPIKGTKFYFVCFSVYLLSFCTELIGVNTGLIFGNYSYGDVLGIQFLRTPFIIGINWLLLTYCTAAFSSDVFASTKYKNSGPAFAALLMVSLDVLIEPVAQKYNLWHWVEGYAPLKNYLHWFILSLILQYLLFFTLGNIQNKTAKFLFFLQFGFFFITYFFVK